MLPTKFLSKYASKTYIIDIVGSCNLSCPSCPSGSYKKKNPSGFMNQETFEKIIKRISFEEPGTTVALYNWTEPLFHPKLPIFINLVHSYGLKCTLSTNLNILKNENELAKANPESITISLSGFYQDTYVIGHENGDIEVVKNNMLKLSNAIKKHNATIDVTVYFHKYKYNLKEVSLMKEFSEKLGFNFGSGWAYYMPLERVLDYKKNIISIEEKEFIEDNLALNLNEAITASNKLKEKKCTLQDNIITINHKGDVQLCCAVYDASKFSLGQYVDMDTKEITEKINTHSFCNICQKNGLHIYCTWHNYPELHTKFDTIATENMTGKFN